MGTCERHGSETAGVRSGNETSILPTVFEGVSTKLRAALLAVKADKGGKESYFEMVSPDEAEHIRSIARDSFEVKGMGLQLIDFAEHVAWNYLAARRIVEEEAVERGLEQVHKPSVVIPDTPAAILGFNEMGGIIRLSSPDEDGDRDIEYTRLHLRRPNPNIQAHSIGRVQNKLFVGGGVFTTSFNTTSPLQSIYQDLWGGQPRPFSGVNSSGPAQGTR